MQFKLRTILVSLAAISVLFGVTTSVWRTYNMALDAENELQALTRTCNAICEFVKTNEGNWPQSWSELADSNPSIDVDWASDQLTVNFEMDADQLRSLSAQEFDAIIPKTGYYNYEPEFRQVIDTLQCYRPLK